MNKKFLTVILGLGLAFTLAACGEQAQESPASPPAGGTSPAASPSPAETSPAASPSPAGTSPAATPTTSPTSP
ncbi:hypothetical protein [Floridanema evergladense]|uniref:Uncharacterized protein n=1 Tax=Floridaenema evergladense BLCC-F167 TaxID=3153639 RepID=A0ABV4WRC2_9CYAN